MTALAQLLRWLQGRPVLPIATWRYWASDDVGLLDANTVDTLEAAGYPKNHCCVLCGEDLTNKNFGWWNLSGTEGTCCYPNQGCRQIPSQSRR